MEPSNDDIEVIEADGDDEIYYLGDDEDNNYIENDEDDDDCDEPGIGDRAIGEMYLENKPESDDSDFTFTAHKKAVMCVALDPKTSELAVSGGEDDSAFVWNINTGEVLFECTGHTDSVICASFSFDGVYVAVGDMKGLIKVWKVATKKEVWFTETSDLLWLEWHHRSHVLLAGTIDGMVWMWRIPSGELKTFSGPKMRADCGTFTPDGTRAVVGYESGEMKVLDLKNCSVIFNITGNAHKDTITSLDCHPDNALVISGSVLATLDIDPGTANNDSCSVEAVGFCHCLPYAATGTVNGVLNLWDVPTQTKRHTCKHEAGITRLVWEPQSQLLYTANLDGVVRLWDSRTGNMEVEWFGHSSEILDIALSRDGNMIMTGSQDRTCKIFKINKPDR